MSQESHSVPKVSGESVNTGEVWHHCPRSSGKQFGSAGEGFFGIALTVPEELMPTSNSAEQEC
jgi:hypothetical protein